MKCFLNNRLNSIEEILIAVKNNEYAHPNPNAFGRLQKTLEHDI